MTAAIRLSTAQAATRAPANSATALHADQHLLSPPTHRRSRCAASTRGAKLRDSAALASNPTAPCMGLDLGYCQPGCVPATPPEIVGSEIRQPAPRTRLGPTRREETIPGGAHRLTFSQQFAGAGDGA